TIRRGGNSGAPRSERRSTAILRQRHALNLRFQSSMQAATVAKRQLKYTIVGREDQNVPGRVQNGGTNTAMLQMFLHLLQYIRIERSIQIARDVVPNVLAIYNHGNHLPF